MEPSSARLLGGAASAPYGSSSSAASAGDGELRGGFWDQQFFRPWHDKLRVPFWAAAALSGLVLAGFIGVVELAHIETADEMESFNFTTTDQLAEHLFNMTANATAPKPPKRHYPIAEVRFPVPPIAPPFQSQRAEPPRVSRRRSCTQSARTTPTRSSRR